MEKPLRGHNRLDAAEDHDRAARLFRIILQAAEKRRERKRREAEVMGRARRRFGRCQWPRRGAAIYSRVSTIHQGEGYSPGIQQAKLLEKARAEGYTVPPEWMFLDKHTGKDTERPTSSGCES